jgi:hypothetical protein
VAATSVWVATSVGSSMYTANFGRYNETYGAPQPWGRTTAAGRHQRAAAVIPWDGATLRAGGRPHGRGQGDWRSDV